MHEGTSETKILRDCFLAWWFIGFANFHMTRLLDSFLQSFCAS